MDKTTKIHTPGEIKVGWGMLFVDFPDQSLSFKADGAGVIAYLPTKRGGRIVIGEVEAIAAKIVKRVFPPYMPIATPRDSGGAGSVLFYNFDQEAAVGWTLNQGQREDSPNKQYFHRNYIAAHKDTILQPYYADQLPPFDIEIATPCGKTVSLNHIEFLHEGWGLSVDEVQENKQWTIIFESAEVCVPQKDEGPFDLLKKLW